VRRSPGIEEKYHTKILRCFKLCKSFNGESSTGIGLNLVMKLIERNDVSINITNNSDVGCDFVISNLEIASNKASLLLDLTKKILKIDLFIMF
jgi:light-regulated signal transduction histidine kinase (bacteriophytochrome)